MTVSDGGIGKGRVLIGVTFSGKIVVGEVLARLLEVRIVGRVLVEIIPVGGGLVEVGSGIELSIELIVVGIIAEGLIAVGVVMGGRDSAGGTIVDAGMKGVDSDK